MGIIFLLIIVAIMVAAAILLNKATTKEGPKIEKFFRFDTLSGVQLIRIFYPAAAFVVTITSFWIMFYASKATKLFGQAAGTRVFFWGIVILIAGNLVLRIFCEALVVLFKIHRDIEALKDQTVAKDKKDD